MSVLRYTHNHVFPDSTNLGGRFSAHIEVFFVPCWYLSACITKHWAKEKFN